MYLSMRTSILNPRTSFAYAAKTAGTAGEHALGLISNLVKKSGRRKCDRHEERHTPLRRWNERLADVLKIAGAQSDRDIFKGILRRDFQFERHVFASHCDLTQGRDDLPWGVFYLRRRVLRAGGIAGGIVCGVVLRSRGGGDRML